MDRGQRNEALNEARILQSLTSPYIVSYHSSFIENEKLCIVMEFCENGDLAQLLKVQHGQFLEEDTIWKYFIEVCLALLYLHNRKILHRDIKTMNVFLSKDFHVRLGDLGVAKVLSQNTNFAHTMVGTPYYLSPELCQEKPYNEKSDVWSLGCVLYELCALKHPFEARNQAALIMKIIQGRYDALPNSYSKDLINVVTQCLQKDYRKRPTIPDILSYTSVQMKARSLRIDMPNKDDLSLKVVVKINTEPKKRKPKPVKSEQKQVPAKVEEKKESIPHEENKDKLSENKVHQEKKNIPNPKPKPEHKINVVEKHKEEHKEIPKLPPLPRHEDVKSAKNTPTNKEFQKDIKKGAEATPSSFKDKNFKNNTDGKLVPSKPANNSRLTPQAELKARIPQKPYMNQSIRTSSTNKKTAKKSTNERSEINSVQNLPDFVGEDKKKKQEKPYTIKKPTLDDLLGKTVPKSVEVEENNSDEAEEEDEENESKEEDETKEEDQEETKEIESSFNPKLLEKKKKEYEEKLSLFEKHKKDLSKRIPIASIERCCKLSNENRNMVFFISNQ